jgi:energy-coupling factor transport system substrate-specific component
MHEEGHQMATGSMVRPISNAWTTLDIVVVSVIGVIFGLLNSPFGLVYQSFQAAFGPIGANIFGVFNISQCLAMFIVRKPGAALVNMLINGLVQMLSGNPAGAITLGWGITQGLGAELVFMAARYRHFDWKVMFLAGAWANVLSNFWTYGVYGFGDQSVAILIAGTILGFFTYGILSGLVALAIGKALQASGVLRSFAAGRQAAR